MRRRLCRGGVRVSATIETRSDNRLLAVVLSEFPDDAPQQVDVRAHDRGDELFHEGDPIDVMTFPLSGLVSLTIDTTEGQTVEVAVAGAEGIVGVSRYLGNPTADTNAMVQVSGTAAHVAAEHVLRWAADSPTFRSAIDRYLRSMMVEMSQSAVCNQLHSVEQRTSRWLLHASDRSRTKDLRLTHEFLAQMLAVRRSSVTTVVGIFTRAGLASTQRGLISIEDRDGLRALACECYEIVRRATPQ